MAMKGFTNKQTLTQYQKDMLQQFGGERELSEFNVSQRKQIGDMIKLAGLNIEEREWSSHPTTRSHSHEAWTK
jgi:hypothetical protein